MERVIKRSFAIGRSPSEVFDFLADLSNWPRLDDTVVRLVAPDRLALGSQGTVTNRRAVGILATTSWTITEFDPGARFTNRIDGSGYALTETVELAATPTGTAMSVTDRLWSTSLVGRLMVPLSTGIVRRDLEKRSARLKTLIEAEPA